MKNFFPSLLCITLCAATTSYSQSTPEVTLTLRTTGDQRVFRIGEAIRLEARFSASVSSKYEVHESLPRNFYRSPTLFTSEPSANVIDPFGDYVYEGAGGVGGAAPQVWPLTSEGVVIRQTLNDWLSFQKPGRYRIVEDNENVTMAGQGRTFNPRNPVPLKSNSLEIEIIAPESGWADRQLQEAVRTLEQPFPTAQAAVQPQQNGVRGGIPGSAFPQTGAASATLRYLATPGAARALVRFLDSVTDGNIQAGLWASPHRREVIRAMEEELDSPGFEVRDYWMDRLIWLSAGNAIGPRRDGSPRQPDPKWLQRLQVEWKSQAAQYAARLEKALPQKRGNAVMKSSQALASLRQSLSR